MVPFSVESESGDYHAILTSRATSSSFYVSEEHWGRGGACRRGNLSNMSGGSGLGW